MCHTRGVASSRVVALVGLGFVLLVVHLLAVRIWLAAGLRLLRPGVEVQSE